VPAKVRFISAEPLIGELTLNDYSETLAAKFQWIIIGGESGNDNGKFKYRPCELGWIENLIIQSQNYGLSVFVKQLGTYLSKTMGCKDRHAGNINEWPETLQVRDFPEDVSRYKLTN
jgi:protein gp37